MAQRKVAFLSAEGLEGFSIYDQLAEEPFAALGWAVDTVPWQKKGVHWGDYEVVIVRSTWDYQNHLDAFVEVLKEIDESDAKLENSIEIMLWNARKTYLKELGEKGVPVVPTKFGAALQDSSAVEELFAAVNAAEIVVKPVVSANADDTYRLKRDADKESIARVVEAFQAKEYMAQPFIRSVVDEGEFSLFYFTGRYSHTILKVPAKGDFRVQEEHGGVITTVAPDADLLEASKLLLDKLPGKSPLYARLDFVRMPDTSYAVMEVELIEPSLYFNYDPLSAGKFAQAFADRYGTGPTPSA